MESNSPCQVLVDSKAEREEAQATLAQLEARYRAGIAVEPAGALAADPDIRRAEFDAFRLGSKSTETVVRYAWKALVSSAFGETKNLSDLGDAGDPALR